MTSAVRAPADPEVSVLILSWNTAELTCACLRSVLSDPSDVRREVIVVDNASHDGSADRIAREFPGIVLVRNAENRLYAAGNNQAAEHAHGAYLCLLNSDTVLRPGVLGKLRDYLRANQDCGAVAPKLLNLDGSVQDVCRRFPNLLVPLVDSTRFGDFWPGTWIRARGEMKDFDHLHSRDVDQPPATCLMLSRTLWDELGGFDPRLSLFFNDVDLCRRIWKRGKRIWFLAEAEVFHHLGASTAHYTDRNRNTLWFENREVYYEKHHGAFGRAWTRFLFRVWSWQVALGIRLGPKTAEQKRAALADLRRHVSECLR